MDDRDLAFMPATELCRLIRRREISPVEAADRALARIDRVNPVVNAYCTVAADQARAAAREAEAAVVRGDALGPLHGVPVAIKDMSLTAGIRTTFGSRLFADYVPTEDALDVARLKQAGAIVIGKTNTPEFAAGPNTVNVLFGATRNPWNLERSAGGSSGGSAVALACGLMPLATGGDLGGSLRIPAERLRGGRLPHVAGAHPDVPVEMDLRAVPGGRPDGPHRARYGADAGGDGRARRPRADLPGRAGSIFEYAADGGVVACGLPGARISASAGSIQRLRASSRQRAVASKGGLLGGAARRRSARFAR